MKEPEIKEGIFVKHQLKELINDPILENKINFAVKVAQMLYSFLTK